MPLIYTLNIEGVQKPATLPMARLAGYMADFAALLGEQEHVRFAALEAGSAIISAGVDAVAAPKVGERVAAAAADNATGDLRKALNSLNRRLAADNATGSLTASSNRGGETAALSLPGRGYARQRPQPFNDGVIRQPSAIDGIPISVGGSSRVAHVVLHNHSGARPRVDITRKQAMAIAQYLYRKTIRLHGAGDWLRDKNGQWRLKKLRVDKFEVLDDAPLSETLERLRAIRGSGWANMNNPFAFLDDLRYGPGEGAR